MSTTPQQLSPCAIWCATELSRDTGGCHTTYLQREAAIAGFSAPQLAAALVAIGAHVTGGGTIWTLTEAQCAYWRRQVALQALLAPVTAPVARPSSPGITAAAKAAIAKATPIPPRPATNPGAEFLEHLAKCQARAATKAAVDAPPAEPVINVAAIYAARRRQTGH